jgi:hypothetical protein
MWETLAYLYSMGLYLVMFGLAVLSAAWGTATRSKALTLFSLVFIAWTFTWTSPGERIALGVVAVGTFWLVRKTQKSLESTDQLLARGDWQAAFLRESGWRSPQQSKTRKT